jgi:hypothetical protein
MDRVEGMRRAREGVHTFLLLYLNIRSRVGSTRLIAILEGREDVPVYDIWLARELGDEMVEPMEVKGKGNILNLSRLIHSSASNRLDKVILCIDHDFDGSRDFNLPENTYLTSAYSIENMLISDLAIDRLLIRAFNAIGPEQEIRKSVVKIFSDRLSEFNDAMLSLNAHIRFARLSGVHTPGLPDSVADAIGLTFDAVTEKFNTSDSQKCVEFLKLGASPLPAVLAENHGFLEDRDLTRVGRGKFLLDFAKRFVALLFLDRRAEPPRFFLFPNKSLPDPNQNLLVNLANAAPTPPCFRTFIQDQIVRWQACGLTDTLV